MITIKDFRQLAVMAVSVLLSACAQTPPVVSASLPLLPTANIAEHQSVPAQIAEAIESNQNQVVLSNGTRVAIGEKYFSALGQECVEVRATSNTTHIRHVLCKGENHWRVLPSVAAVKSETDNLFKDNAQEIKAQQ